MKFLQLSLSLRLDTQAILDKEVDLTVAMAKVDYDNSQSSYNSAIVQIIVVISSWIICCYCTWSNNCSRNFKANKESCNRS